MDLKSLLESISSLFFYPVLVLLILMLAWIAVSSGIFLRSAIGRYGGARPLEQRYTSALIRVVTAREDNLDLRLEEVLSAAEHAITRSLNALRFAVRAGPSLGLMGTLIPMAAALNGLAQGDLPALADNMVVAFSSTIVGIGIGVVAYVIAMVRESWSAQDMDAIRFAAERLLREYAPDSAEPAIASAERGA